MTEFLYVSALCGAGKTFGTYEHIKNNMFSLKRCILVQPTHENLKESQQALSLRGINSKIICDDNSSSLPVSQRIISHKFEYNEVLLVTHEGFVRASGNIQNKQDITVFFDEVYSGSFSMTTINLQYNKDIILNNIAVNRTKKANVLELSLPSSKTKLVVSKKGMDSVNDLLRVVTDKLVSTGVWNTYTIETMFESFKSDDTYNMFTCFSTIKKNVFEGFKELTFLSAKFEDQMMYHVLEKQGATFKKRTDIHLQYTEHKNTQNTFIHYMTDKNYSLGLREVMCENNSTFLQNMCDEANVIIQGRDHLLVPNNDINTTKNEKIKESLKNTEFTKNATTISSYVHGLNQFRFMNDIFFMSALNYSDHMTVGIVEILELDEYQIEKTNLLSSTYQACSRISIRDINDNSNRNIIVPDARSAYHLAEIYNIPESRIISHESQMFLPPQKASGRPKKEVISTTQERSLKRNIKKKIIKECQEFKGKELIDGFKFQFAILDKLRTTKVYKKVWFNEAQEIIPFFKKEADFTSESKETENRLLMPCVLLEERDSVSNTRFGSSNNQGFSCLMFDKDTAKNGRDMSFEEGVQFFKSLGCAFYMYETFSGNDRFRVVIPITGIITKEAYELITTDINMKCHKIGFDFDISTVCEKTNKPQTPKLGPFDGAGRNGSAKFFLPNHMPDTTIKTYEQTGKIFDPCDYMKKATTLITLDQAHRLSNQEGSLTKSKLAENLRKTRTASYSGPYGEQKILEAQQAYLLNGGNQEQPKLIGTMIRYGSDDQEILNWFAMNYNGKSSKRDIEREVKARIKELRKRHIG